MLSTAASLELFFALDKNKLPSWLVLIPLERYGTRLSTMSDVPWLRKERISMMPLHSTQFHVDRKTHSDWRHTYSKTTWRSRKTCRVRFARKENKTLVAESTISFVDGVSFCVHRVLRSRVDLSSCPQLCASPGVLLLHVCSQVFSRKRRITKKQEGISIRQHHSLLTPKGEQEGQFYCIRSIVFVTELFYLVEFFPEWH